MLALRDLLSRLPNLTSICLSGLYRGLVQEALLTVADTQYKRLRMLFVEPLLLDTEAISSLSRLTQLRTYGTRIVTYKSKDKRIGKEIVDFFRSDVVRQLRDIYIRVDRAQDISLLDREVKQAVRMLKRTGKLQHCRWGTGSIVDCFINEIHRIGL